MTLCNCTRTVRRVAKSEAFDMASGSYVKVSSYASTPAVWSSPHAVHKTPPASKHDQVEAGGPEKLEEPCNEKRTLFLCYPDEFEDDDVSLGLRCIHNFEGDVVSG